MSGPIQFQALGSGFFRWQGATFASPSIRPNHVVGSMGYRGRRPEWPPDIYRLHNASDDQRFCSTEGGPFSNARHRVRGALSGNDHLHSGNRRRLQDSVNILTGDVGPDPDVEAGYSASSRIEITAAVPEPSSFGLFAIGVSTQAATLSFSDADTRACGFFSCDSGRSGAAYWDRLPEVNGVRGIDLTGSAGASGQVS